MDVSYVYRLDPDWTQGGVRGRYDFFLINYIDVIEASTTTFDINVRVEWFACTFYYFLHFK